MSSDVWIGTILSIPVSLGVALVTPRVQRWLERRGAISHAKKRDRMRDEYNEVLHYALHTDFLLGRILVIVLLFVAAILVFVVALPVLPVIGDTLRLLVHRSRPNVSKSYLVALTTGLTSIAVASAIAYSVAIVQMVWKYMRLFSNVRFFKSYVESIPSDLRDKRLEEIVICAALERAVPASAMRWYESREHKDDSRSELKGGTESPSQV